MAIVIAAAIAGGIGQLFGAVGDRTADVADTVRGFNIADRPVNVFVPDFRGPVPFEPTQRHALKL
jgi:hypothetical protein